MNGVSKNALIIAGIIVMLVAGFLIRNERNRTADYDERGIEVQCVTESISYDLGGHQESVYGEYINSSGNAVRAEIKRNKNTYVGEEFTGMILPESPDEVYCKPDGILMTFVYVFEYGGFAAGAGLLIWGIVKGVLEKKKFNSWRIEQAARDQSAGDSLGSSDNSQTAAGSFKRYSAADYERGYSSFDSDPNSNTNNNTGTNTAFSGEPNISVRDRLNAERMLEEGDIKKGIIGALLGVSLGLIVWCLIGIAGFISSLGSLALIAGAYFGYRFMAKGIGKEGTIIVMLIVALAVFIGTRACYSIYLSDLLLETNRVKLPNDEIPGIGKIFMKTGYYLKYTGMSENYHKDMGTGYLFTALAAITFFYRLRRKE